MMLQQNKSKPVRKSTGNSIAEFGPGLGILLICFFFPLVDMLSVGVSYGLCRVLNFNQTHEASLIPHQEAANQIGIVKKGIPDQWLNGMGRLVKLNEYPQTSVTYRSGQTGLDAVTDKIVLVQTTVTCSPLLPVPLPVANIPGLNGPMIFVMASERPMENPDYAP